MPSRAEAPAAGTSAGGAAVPARATTSVFFRDDDVGVMTGRFRAVFELLRDEGVPCNYQIVPALLDADTIRFLRAQHEAHPERVRLNQHGYCHQRHDGERVRWDEFGGRRPFEEQREAIDRGRRRLAAELGEAFSAEVFTPPAHKYDAGTVRALGELGFRVISSSVHPELPARLANAAARGLRRIDVLGRSVSYHPGPVPGSALREISVSIDVDEATDWRGRRLTKPLAALLRELARARAVLPIVGVMLHHDTYADAGKLETLRALVRVLRTDPGIRFTTIEALAAARPA